MPNSSSLLQNIKFTIVTSCLIGFGLSFYSFYVELNAVHDPTYTAYCDINEHVSCTKAFTSKYGKGFGILGKIFGDKSALNLPNSFYGMTFYLLYFFINMIDVKPAVYVMIFLGAISNLMSIYLAAILIFVLYDFCFICVATYLINAILLFCSIYKKSALRLIEQEATTQKKDS